jgi:hypothetical protein
MRFERISRRLEGVVEEARKPLVEAEPEEVASSSDEDLSVLFYFVFISNKPSGNFLRLCSISNQFDRVAEVTVSWFALFIG